jgi:thioredoxin-related protein
MNKEFIDNWGLQIIILIIIVIVATLCVSNYFGICKMQQKENSYNYANDIISVQKTETDVIENDIISVQKTEKAILTFYYADWCGHCQKFKPEWEKLKNYLKTSDLNNSLILEEISSENQKRCTDAKIKGFPAIILQKSNGSIVQYSEYPRTFESVMNFLQSNM